MIRQAPEASQRIQTSWVSRTPSTSILEVIGVSRYVENFNTNHEIGPFRRVAVLFGLSWLF
jgi:hypothetical protein